MLYVSTTPVIVYNVFDFMWNYDLLYVRYVTDCNITDASLKAK